MNKINSKVIIYKFKNEDDDFIDIDRDQTEFHKKGSKYYEM